MVEVDKVTKFYGDLEAVKDVSFKVEKGEILGLLGPNAAGKTTLMRIMTGYLPATRGTVRIAGFDVFNDVMEVKKRIGYLPETPPLYVDMTVAEYLRFVAELKGVPRAERKARVEQLIDTTSLESVAGRLIENISKGYRQRVGLAQALVNNPEVLVLDEPTVGLDPKQIIEIRELIKKLGREHTVILSSHILSEVSLTCDRLVILNCGEVVAIDTKESLFAKLEGGGSLEVVVQGPADKVAGALGKIDGAGGVQLEGEESGEARLVIEMAAGADIRGRVFDCAVENGWKLLGMTRRSASLEDVFLSLTGDVAADNDAEVAKGE